MKIYLNLLTMYNLSIKDFINNVGDVKTRFVVLHFIIIAFMLFFSVFFFIAKAGPYELYSRMYTLSTDLQAPDTSAIQIETDADGRIVSIYSPASTIESDNVGYAFFDEITPERLDSLNRDKLWFCFSNEFAAYVDLDNRLATFTDSLNKDSILNFDIKEMFNTMALANNYWVSFMIPILLMLFLVIIVLQIIFLLFSCTLLGVERIIHQSISYGGRVRILVFGSTLPALMCVAIGFVAPVVHIILFQIVSILVVIYILRRYDRYYVPKD